MSTQQKNTELLKTPQSLIHVKHNMTIAQYKYWIILLHDVKDQIQKGVEPDEKGFYYIPMKKINDMLEVKKSQRKSIIFEDLRKLKDITVSYNILEKDGQKAKVGHGFISEWSVSNSRIGYVLPRFFINAMLELNENSKSIFQLINWEVFNSFSGKYEAIIYKLCKDYIGVGRTPYMTVEEYRDYIGLKEGEYSVTDNFTRRCIKNPIRNINKNEISDIKVEFILARKNRKIVGLHFEMEEKKQQSLPFPEFNPNPSFMFAKINIPIEKQNHYLEKYQPDQVEAIIGRANEYADETKQKGKKTNLEGIYNKAFAEGWGVENLEAEKKAQAEKEAQRKAESEAKADKKRKEAEKKAQEKQEKEKTIKIFNELDDEEKTKRIQAVIDDNMGFMGNIFLESHKKNGFGIIKEPMFYAMYLKVYGD